MSKEKNKTELPQVMEGELQTRLIKLREDAGYDIPQMADALCLSEEVIVNLENEDFDAVAEPPYVRGYLRYYAKLGEEDPKELITRYETLRGADPSELDYQIKASANTLNKPRKRISPVWAQLILLAILIGGIALISSIPGVKTWLQNTWNSISSQLQHPSNTSDNPSLLGELPVPVPLPEDEPTATTANKQTVSATAEAEATQAQNDNAEKQTTTANTSTESKTDSSSATNTPATTAEAAPATPTTDTPEASTQTDSSTAQTTDTEKTEEVPATSTDGMINIKLVFNKEVWLRIKDKQNKTVFEGLNKEGTEKIIDLKKPLTFRVGNAQGLSLFIDNKAVDISTYINGSIANFTLE